MCKLTAWISLSFTGMWYDVEHDVHRRQEGCTNECGLNLINLETVKHKHNYYYYMAILFCEETIIINNMQFLQYEYWSGPWFPVSVSPHPNGGHDTCHVSRVLSPTSHRHPDTIPTYPPGTPSLNQTPIQHCYRYKIWVKPTVAPRSFNKTLGKKT